MSFFFFFGKFISACRFHEETQPLQPEVDRPISSLFIRALLLLTVERRNFLVQYAVFPLYRDSGFA